LAETWTGPGMKSFGMRVDFKGEVELSRQARGRKREGLVL